MLNTTSEDGQTDVSTTYHSALFYVFYYSMFAGITCVNIPGNLLVIVTILRHERLRDHANIYLVNQAVADLLLAMLYPLYNMMNLDTVTLLFRNYWICTVYISQVVVAVIASPMSLVALTANRYIAIVHPLRYATYVTTRTTAVSIGCLWMFVEVFALVAHVAFPPEKDIIVCTYESAFSLQHAVALNVVSGLLPMLALSIMYFQIMKVVRRQARAIAAQKRVFVIDRCYPKQEKKSTALVTLLLGFYTATWLPVFFYFLYYFYCGRCEISPYFRATTRILVYSNSAVNIFVFAGRLSLFRTYLMMELKGIQRVFCFWKTSWK